MSAHATSGSAAGFFARARAMFAEERETYLLGLVRIAFGVMLHIHVHRLHEELKMLGYFGDRFYLPLVPETWVPSAAGYQAMLLAMAVLTAGIVLGVRARECLLLCAGMGLYLLACDRLQYHNNRFALLLLSFLLAFTPCDRSFALASYFKRAGGARGPAPIWGQRLFQLQVSLIYASSSLSKIADPDWFGGQVMWVRAARSLAMFRSIGIELPSFVVAAFGSKLLLSIISKLAIGGELFLAVGLWVPRTRVLALWWGVVFHLAIELSARVELFSYLMWCSYLTYVTPELQERRLLVAQDSRGMRAIAAMVRALDWLRRWSIELVPREQTLGTGLRVIDRDGSESTGVRSFRTLALFARTLPAFFLLWGPLALLTVLSGRSRQTHASS